MHQRTRPVKALGEVILRAKNLDVMQEFYEHTVGLFAGPFPADHSSRAFVGVEAAQGTLHHLALTISLSDYEAERDRLGELGLQVETREHSWTHWRSIYFCEPEGNVVELVCYDASV